MGSLEDRIEALEAEVVRLRRLVGIDQRLGPQRETPEEAEARARKLADTLVAATKVTEWPPVDRSNLCTTNGKPVEEVRASQTSETGQHDGYIVLCADERAKGFVRPYRDLYRHVGPRGPKYALRDLSERQQSLFGGNGYVGFEPYPPGSTEWYDNAGEDGPGRFWTQEQLDAVGKGCGTVTTMGRALSETYARDPKFYGQTFCCNCNRHLPVDEFVWADGQRVGS